MNDYDDLDDYSSANSFRARSNTWPLNRPDFAVPSSGANIDETLPEIELEDDDLFTTNENWTTGMVDHDIMSWDPILNAQNQQQQQALNNQPSTVHHHHQQQPPPPPQQTSHHQNTQAPTQIHAQQQHQQTSHQLTQLVSSASLQQTASDQTRQQQQSIHHIQNHIHQQPSQQQQQTSHHQHHNNHRHQQPQDPTHHLHQHHRSDQQQPQLIHHPQQPHHNHHHPQHPHTQHHHHQQQQHHHHHHHHQRNDGFLDGVSLSSVIVSTQDTTAQLQAPPPPPQPNQQTQLPHQTSPQPSHHQHVQQHQTLNSVVRCLEHEDVNEYNLQLQHLHLDNNPLPPLNDTNPQDHPFAPTLTSLGVHNTTTSAAAAAVAAAGNIRNDNYNISPDPSHHDLQPLTSARFDLDSTNNIADYDLKEPLGGLADPLDQHGGVGGGSHHLLTQQQPHLHEQQQQQLIQQHHHQHPLEHQIHTSHGVGLTSSSLDNHSTAGSNVLSSSLGTSGIGLSGDLEDLDYKHNVVDSVNFLQSSHSDEQPRLQVQQQQQQQQSEIHQQQSSDNVIANDTKQRSNSTSTPKAAKQNVPRRNAWGNLSYADLISQAINSTSDKRLTLSQIYDWMVQHVPYFKDKGDSNSSAGWKNSVRHNLSLHSRFKRLQNEGTGKSSWWTINPEANVGKCARRRAASMEASKYEKKRGRAKKKAEAIRAGLVSYPSLTTNSSLNGSTSTLEQQSSQAQSISQFHSSMGPVAAGSSGGLQSETQQQADAQQQQLQQPTLEQFASAQELTSQQQQQQQPQQQQHRPEMQFQTLDQYGTDRPSQHQQQQLQQLQQSDAHSCEELDSIQSSIEQNHFSVMQQQQQQQHQHHHHHHHQQPMPAQLQHHLEQAHSEESNKNSKIQQQQQQQQSQYYYQFELSTAL